MPRLVVFLLAGFLGMWWTGRLWAAVDKISFNKATNTFQLSGEEKFSLFYRQGQQTEAVAGGIGTSMVYAGTCSSGGTCVPHTVIRGIIKFEGGETEKFVMTNSELKVAEKYNSTQIALTDEENYWIENGINRSKIVINEFVYRPISGEKEWVELYNMSENTVDISDWILADADNHVKSLGMTIPAYGFCTYENSVGWLNDTGDSIVLIGMGTTIDQVSYSKNLGIWVNGKIISSMDLAAGKSIGRSPDGSSTWQVFDSPTKNAPGPTVTPTPTATQSGGQATPTLIPSLTPTLIPSPTPTVEQTTPTAVPTTTPMPIIDTQAPEMEIVGEIINSGYIEIEAEANEIVKDCWLETEGIINGIFENGDIGGWESGGNASWYADNSVKLSGNYAARSGNLNDLNLADSWIKQNINLNEEATLSFWWRVSSEQDWDFLKFYIDGYQQAAISGWQDWTRVEVKLMAGSHTLTWSYDKDFSNTAGADAGWIDDIRMVAKTNQIEALVNGNRVFGRIIDPRPGVNSYRIGCHDQAGNTGYSDYRELDIGGYVVQNPTETSEDTTESQEIMTTPTPTPTAEESGGQATPTATQSGGQATAKIISNKKVLGVKSGVVPTAAPIPVIKETGETIKKETGWREIYWGAGGLGMGLLSGYVLAKKEN